MNEYEFFGYLTLVLSVLVTSLIGFQIANYIMIGKRIKQEIERQVSQVKSDIAKENILSQIKLLDISIRGYMESRDWNMVIFSTITKINYLIEIKDVMRIDGTVEFIERLWSTSIESSIDKELKTRLSIVLIQSMKVSAKAYNLLKKVDS